MYCLTRKDTEAMAQHLLDRGLSAAHYHADMDPATREQVMCIQLGALCSRKVVC